MSILFIGGWWLAHAVKVAIGWTGSVEELQCFWWFWVWCVMCTMEFLIINNTSTAFLRSKKFNSTCHHQVNRWFHEAWISTLHVSSCLYYYYHSCCFVNFYWVRGDCLQALMNRQCRRRRFAYFLKDDTRCMMFCLWIHYWNVRV